MSPRICVTSVGISRSDGQGPRTSGHREHGKDFANDRNFLTGQTTPGCLVLRPRRILCHDHAGRTCLGDPNSVVQIVSAVVGRVSATGQAQYIIRLNESSGAIHQRLLFCFSPAEPLSSTTRSIDHVSCPARFAATPRASVRTERQRTNRRHAYRPHLAVLEDRARPLDTNGDEQRRRRDPESHARYAVAHAQSGDTILLTAAIKSPIVLTHGELVVNQNVTIESVPSRTPTISGDGISRRFRDCRRRHRQPGQPEHHRRQRPGRQPERHDRR